MTAAVRGVPSRPFVLRLGRLLERISDSEFFEFCQRNPELRIERTAEGEIIVMPPAGRETGGRGFLLAAAFSRWVERDGTGKGFDSSTGFTLPNGAIRSPDLSWIRFDRWNALSDREKRAFAPICPDFVAELRSPSDALDELPAKMREYVENGVRLGWLIDPEERVVYVYRPGVPVQRLDAPAGLSGEPELPGLEVDLRPIWG
jgi:Uma2 family endonuclease